MPFKDELNNKIAAVFGDNPMGFSITVQEDVGATVVGYRGVSYVSKNEIKFRVSRTFITIFGVNLEILDINGQEAIVGGKITKFEVGQ